MRLLALAALVAAALVESAGAGTIDPSSLVLRKVDLPKGYSILRANTGRVTNTQAAQGNAELSRSFARWGRLTGYGVEYDGGLAGNVASRVDVFRGARGAQAYLRWLLAVSPSRAGLRYVRLPAGPGEAAFVVRKSFGGAPWVDVEWRYRTVVASANADSLGLRRTVALARVQQRRMAAALG